ncbi:MAG: HypC/HybG/HupF family hydrogenase formation chaperone [Candidatus Omnitrophica bacterium]|nr:HypC/HybG/HupF family hydrogenase formation chaperone [Candidatus Omnitrophota bacterium]
MCLAIPGKVVSISAEGPDFRTGMVQFGGISKTVNLSYVPRVKIGDYVMVHVGFAISIVEEKEAQEVFTYLEEMQELKEL